MTAFRSNRRLSPSARFHNRNAHRCRVAEARRGSFPQKPRQDGSDLALYVLSPYFEVVIA